MRLALILALGLATPAIAQTKAEQKAAAMTPEQVAAKVEIRGQGPLDPVLTLSTRPIVFVRFGGDQFLRANIDKATGAVSFELYMIVEGRDSLRPNRVTYLVGGELQTAAAQRIDFDVSCYRSSCTHIEHSVADLPAEHVKALAQCQTDDRFARFRVFGAYVEGRDLALPCGEVAGLLLAVEKAAPAKSG